MFFKKNNRSNIEVNELIETAMISLAESIKSISLEGMFSFFEEALSLDKSAKSVEPEAVKKACVLYNYIFAKNKLDEKLSSSVKHYVGILKKSLDIDLSDDSHYWEDVRLAKRQLKGLGGGVEYSLITSNLFFDIYDDLVSKRTNRTKTYHDEKICAHCGIDKIHELAMVLPVNQALMSGISGARSCIFNLQVHL